MKPVLRHIANLWTLMGHPAPGEEWSLEQKLEAIQDAGFDGVCWAPSAELQQGCHERGLLFVGGMASSKRQDFPALCRDLHRFGATHVNVQLGQDSTPTAEALDLVAALMAEAQPLGLHPAIESHRGTCTETPEKLYALADAYQQRTGELLPISWDFSHFAVVKHLLPADFLPRLLVRPDLVQRSQQFHLRPFNGHHAQVPITGADGTLTPEVHAWLPFAEAVLRCWLESNRQSDRELFVCPELGPREGGYALSSFPDSWADAQVLRRVLDALWRRLL